jgi:hypothetical protein
VGLQIKQPASTYLSKILFIELIKHKKYELIRKTKKVNINKNVPDSDYMSGFYKEELPWVLNFNQQ